MKKILLLISFLFLLLFTYSFKPIFNDLFYKHNLIYSDIKYSIYCLKVSDNLTNCDIVNIGNGYIVNTSASNCKFVKSQVSNVLGESVSFKTSKSKLKEIINCYNIKIVKEERIGSIIIIYGYSNKLSLQNSVEVDNLVVNIQMAFNKNVLTIGSPIILGEY